jgi:ABC-type dipeptide/oligopeptide/nickel transport system permease component
MPFINFRHNSIVYAVSKHTNTTVHNLQCVTVLNQDTLQHFPPPSTSTPLSHTTLHLTNCLVSLKGRPCADALTHLHLYFLLQIYILVFEGGKTARFTFNSLLSCKWANMRVLKGGTRWRIWLRHCLTNSKVAISIIHAAIAILHSPDLPAALWLCDRHSH